MMVILLTHAPHTRQAKEALNFAKTCLDNGMPFEVFFYGDGAYHANRLLWQTADIACPSREWASLASKYGFALPVCVSTALARGISDKDNAKRHQLDGDNLRPPFELVGLSKLAMMMNNNSQLVQF